MANTVQQELYGHTNKIEGFKFLINDKAIFNFFKSDYASVNKRGVQEGENNNKEKSEKDDLV